MVLVMYDGNIIIDSNDESDKDYDNEYCEQ